MAIQTIAFDGNDLPANAFRVVDGKEAVRQRLIQRLRAFRGGWLLDTSIGVPYLSDVFVRPATLAPLILAREARKVEDVKSIATDEFVELDDNETIGDDRRWRVTFTATTVEGEAITITENV